VEAIGGIAAVVLAVIGLAGALPPDNMAAISTILIGASLLFEGGTMAASYRQLLNNLEGSGAGSADVGGAVTVEFLAGAAGIVLGILALLGISATVLISASVIAFGAAFLLSSSSTASLSTLWASSVYRREEARMVAREAASAGVGGQVLAGLAAIVLGILALLGINPPILNLVALLSLGVFVVLNGTALGSRSMSAARA